MCKWPFCMLCVIPLQMRSVKDLQAKNLWFLGKKKIILQITLGRGTAGFPLVSSSRALGCQWEKWGRGGCTNGLDTQAGTCRPAARPKRAEFKVPQDSALRSKCEQVSSQAAATQTASVQNACCHSEGGGPGSRGCSFPF